MEPTPRHSRQLIAASLVAALIVGTGGFLLGREAVSPPEPPAGVPPSPPSSPSPAAEPVTAKLSRADLLALADAAADSATSNSPISPDYATMAGKRFDIALPFGCNGPSPDGAKPMLGWRYDADASALRIRVAPVSWPVAEWFRVPPPGLTALEGFWVARPWTSRETCAAVTATAVPPGAEAITLSGQTLGLAQLVMAGSARQLARAEEPYEAVLRVAAEKLRLGSGLRLRLRGRLESFPGGGSTRCIQPGGSEQRPLCLVAVSFDELTVENPVTGETLATWTPTAPDRAD
jgi:hypothetical protein